VEINVPPGSGNEAKETKQNRGGRKPHGGNDYNATHHCENKWSALPVGRTRAMDAPDAESQQYHQEWQQDEIVNHKAHPDAYQECQQGWSTNATQRGKDRSEYTDNLSFHHTSFPHVVS
jgi:hypothetical protein